jgi:hypothetical protein
MFLLATELMKIEKSRAALVTVIIEVIRFFKSSIIVTKNLSSHIFFIFDFLLYFLNYSADILYVKNLKRSNSLKLLLSTFGTYILGRYIIVSTLQFVISRTSTLYFKKILSFVYKGKTDEQNKKREHFLGIIITFFIDVFILGSILYNLKFSWVFDENSSKTYNLIVIVWFTLSITLYMILNTISKIK